MPGYSVREKRQRAGEEAVAGQEEYYKGLSPGWTVVSGGAAKAQKKTREPKFQGGS